MILKKEQERVKDLLKETLTALIRNGVCFKEEFSVDALIGITLDKEDVILVNIQERIVPEAQSNKQPEVKDAQATKRSRKRLHPQKLSESLQNNESVILSDDDDEQPQSKEKEKEEPLIKVNIKQEKDLKDQDSYKDEGVAKEKTLDSVFSSLHPSTPHSSTSQNSSNHEQNLLPHLTPPFQDSMDINALHFATKLASLHESQVKSDFFRLPPFQNCNIKSEPVNEEQIKQEFDPKPVFFSDNHSTLDFSKQTESKPSVQENNGSERITSNQESLNCDICHKHFTRHKNMLMHRKLHFGIYRCYCPICHKGFSGTTNLRGHMQIHMKQADFRCPHCHKAYRYSKDLKRHKANVHNDFSHTPGNKSAYNRISGKLKW